jgi:hypothetical protein
VRLLNPSPGEILDRLTILDLKIAAARKKGIDETHFEAEQASLKEVLQNWNDGVVEDCVGRDDIYAQKKGDIASHLSALAAVNSLLWQAEDDIRATPGTEAFKLAILVKNTARWNDARASHVRELDKLYGIKDGPEKIYTENVR